MSYGRIVVSVFGFLFALLHASAAETKPPRDKSVADIAAAVKPSLVKVIQVGRQGVGGLGSGFVVREDGLIATNRHVIGDARRIKVETSDGKVEEVTEVFASDVHLEPLEGRLRVVHDIHDVELTRQRAPHASCPA